MLRRRKWATCPDFDNTLNANASTVVKLAGKATNTQCRKMTALPKIMSIRHRLDKYQLLHILNTTKIRWSSQKCSQKAQYTEMKSPECVNQRRTTVSSSYISGFDL